jgi:general secretion pathway protein K
MTLKPAYRARNGKLARLSELSLVKGFTPEIVSKLAPFVTVYSEYGGSTVGQAKVNINTAPKEVIVALDASIDDRVAERILDERRLSPFKSIGALANVSGANAISTMSANVGIKGSVFRITSIAQVKDTARTVEAVVLLDSEKVLSWQEY